jgi:hypothetical protein
MEKMELMGNLDLMDYQVSGALVFIRGALALELGVILRLMQQYL